MQSTNYTHSFGNDLIDSSNNQGSLTNPSTRLIGYYFGASWSHSCHNFTTKLSRWYKSINKPTKTLEIIFISSCSSENQFLEYFQSMPWYAIRYGSKLITSLKKSFSSGKCPNLIIFDTKGNIIEKDAYSMLLNSTNWMDIIKKWISSVGASDQTPSFNSIIKTVNTQISTPKKKDKYKDDSYEDESGDYDGDDSVSEDESVLDDYSFGGDSFQVPIIPIGNVLLNLDRIWSANPTTTKKIVNKDGYYAKKGDAGNYYCGRKGLYKCLYGCDGVCGPNNGCNCPACAELDSKEKILPYKHKYPAIMNKSGSKVVKGAGGRYYCGRLGVNKCQFGCGTCGPLSGCNCTDCQELDKKEGILPNVHLSNRFCPDCKISPLYLVNDMSRFYKIREGESQYCICNVCKKDHIKVAAHCYVCDFDLCLDCGKRPIKEDKHRIYSNHLCLKCQDPKGLRRLEDATLYYQQRSLSSANSCRCDICGKTKCTKVLHCQKCDFDMCPDCEKLSPLEQVMQYKYKTEKKNDNYKLYFVSY